VARRQRDELVVVLAEDRIGGEGERVDPMLDETRESRIDVAVAGRVSPSARAAACTSVVSDWEAGFFGLTSKPITVALGTSSCSNSSRLGASVLYRKLVPVTLPPGRLRLDTRPSLTASPPIEKTIGMVAVVALAASGAAALWIATITVTRWRTRSAANAGNRSS